MSAVRRIKPYAFLFAGLALIYHSNFRPVASGDSLTTSVVPFSILLDHTLNVDRFAPYIRHDIPWGSYTLEPSGRHWYSFFPVGGPVLVTPLYLPILAFPSVRHLPPGTLIAIARILEKFIAVILAAGTAVWMLLLLERLAPRRWAWGLTILFALATPQWSISSQALWHHTFGALAITASLYGLARWELEGAESRWLWLCGAWAAVAVSIRVTNIWLVLGLMAALMTRRAKIRSYLQFAIPGVLIAIPLLAYNWLLFHRLTGAAYWDDGNFVKGTMGFLFSPARGLLVQIPVAFFALAVFRSPLHPARQKHRALLTACVIFSVLEFLTMAKFASWWGGFCWGPRYLTEIFGPLVIMMAIAVPVLQERRWRAALISLAVYSGLVQAVGVYFYPNGHWDRVPATVDAQPARIWEWVDNPIVRTAGAGPVWQPYSIVATALTRGLPAAAQQLQQDGIHPY